MCHHHLPGNDVIIIRKSVGTLVQTDLINGRLLSLISSGFKAYKELNSLGTTVRYHMTCCY